MSAATALDTSQQHWQRDAAGCLRAPAVVLACRSKERGRALLVALTAEAQAQGVAEPQLEVSCQLAGSICSHAQGVVPL
jgi:hypothetical protein